MPRTSFYRLGFSNAASVVYIPDMLPFQKARLIGFAVLLFLSGCASSGKSFQTDSLPKIRTGYTNQAQIRQMFGTPLGVRAYGSGGSEWIYDHREVITRDTALLGRITSWISAIVGGPGLASPVNVAYSNEIRHQLVVLFDERGIVQDYVYERTDNPSQNVY